MSVRAHGTIDGFVVWPSNVHDRKEAIHGMVVAFDAAVQSCPEIPAPTRAGWNAFRDSFDAFYRQDEHWYATGVEMDQADAYAQQLQSWQETINAVKCGAPLPDISKAASASDTLGKAQSLLSAAIPVLVLVGALMILPRVLDLIPRKRVAQ